MGLRQVLGWIGVSLWACSGETNQTLLPPPATSTGGAKAPGDLAGAPALADGGAAEGGAASLGAAGAATEPLDLSCGTAYDCSSGAECIHFMCLCPAEAPDHCPGDPKPFCTDLRREPLHCGKCGHECAPKQGCFDGQCLPAPTEVATLSDCGGGVSLAAWGDTLYLSEPQTGRVRALALSSSKVTDFAVQQDHPKQIAADASGVYWINAPITPGSGGALMKRDLEAQAPRALVTSSTDPILAFTLANDQLYYAVGARVHQTGTDEAHANDVVVGMALSSNDKGEPVEAGLIDGLAVTATHLAFSEQYGENVWSHQLAAAVNDRNQYVKLGRNHTSNHQLLAVHAGFAYWEFYGTVVRRSLTGLDSGSMSVAPAWSNGPMSSLVLDDSRLYLSSEEGQIFAHSLEPAVDANQDPEPTWLLTSDQGKITSMVAVGRKLYFINDACQLRYVNL